MFAFSWIRFEIIYLCLLLTDAMLSWKVWIGALTGSPRALSARIHSRDNVTLQTHENIYRNAAENTRRVPALYRLPGGDWPERIIYLATIWWNSFHFLLLTFLFSPNQRLEYGLLNTKDMYEQTYNFKNSEYKITHARTHILDGARNAFIRENSYFGVRII